MVKGKHILLWFFLHYLLVNQENLFANKYHLHTVYYKAFLLKTQKESIYESFGKTL